MRKRFSNFLVNIYLSNKKKERENDYVVYYINYMLTLIICVLIFKLHILC